MKNIVNKFRLFSNAKKEEGAAMVEYALLVALIAIVVMLALGPLGRAISGTFATVTTSLG